MESSPRDPVPPALEVWGGQVGRVCLFALAGVHFVLPFTPMVPDSNSRITLALLVLGAAFLALGVSSFKAAARACWAGFGLLALGVVLTSWTGVSPIQEGWFVKLILLLGLSLGGVAAARTAGRG